MPVTKSHDVFALKLPAPPFWMSLKFRLYVPSTRLEYRSPSSSAVLVFTLLCPALVTMPASAGEATLVPPSTIQPL